jgi:hypothetical protein
MTMNALLLHFLKYLSNQKKPVRTGEIISRMLGYDVKSKDLLELLKSNRYVVIENQKIEITSEGRDFISVMDAKEMSRIESLIHDDYELALIAFLYHRNDFIHLDDFPEILKALAPQHKNSTNDGNLIHKLFELKAYVEKNNSWCIITDIGKSFYDNRIAKHSRQRQAYNKRKEPHESKTLIDVPVLTDSERIWLSELYELIKKGQRVTYRQLWTRLGEKISKDFAPSKVDTKLMSENGEQIRILGVIALEGTFSFVDQIDQVINCIRKIILGDDKKETLTIEEISMVCKLTPSDVSVSLELAGQYAKFYNQSGYKENSRELTSIGIAGDEAIFYNYLNYDGILPHVIRAHLPRKTNLTDYFTTDEITSMNDKLDMLMEHMNKVVLSQEFTYNDLMEEISYLRSLLETVKKKDWKRILATKLADMTAGGVVSSVISEPLSSILKPEITRLINA